MRNEVGGDDDDVDDKAEEEVEVERDGAWSSPPPPLRLLLLPLGGGGGGGGGAVTVRRAETAAARSRSTDAPEAVKIVVEVAIRGFMSPKAFRATLLICLKKKRGRLFLDFGTRSSEDFLA